MANEVDYNPCQYKGNGLTRDFSFDWKVLNNNEIVVELELVSTGHITKLNIGSDYNVEINEVGGNVTLTTAPTEDYYVNISRDTSQYQSKGYSTSTGFQGSEIEKSFDQVSCNLQEMSYKIDSFQKELTAETEEKINDFETDVNNKLEQVNEAASKLNRLDEILEECEGYATTSEEQSIIAQQQATEAKNSATTAEETLKNIQEEAEKQREKIKALGFYQKDGKFFYINEEGEETPLQFEKTDNLFDLVQKDHILTFEEKEGLELLGEYVYKEAQHGRYGYPDFYQKCVDEYETLENKKENIYVSSNITGSISDNNGLISGFNNARYATVNQTIVTEDAQNPWEFVLKVKMPDVAANCAIIGSGADSQKYGMTLRTTTANKLTLYVSGNGINWNIVNAVTSTNTFELDKEYLIKISYSLTGEPENQTATYKVDLKTEKEEVWTNYITKEVTSITSSSSEDTYKIADFTPTLGIDYNVVFTGSIDLNKSYIKIKDEIFWTGVDTFEIRTNLNGHKFYDIKDKNKIDEIYQKTGIAWYYGVDTQNKRILLPRVNKYEVNKGAIPVIGNGKRLGMTLGGNVYETSFWTYNAGFPTTITASGANLGKDTNPAEDGGLSTDPDKSGLIAKLELEQSFSVLYMVVGNITFTQAKTDIVEITTSENDTIPLFTGQYFDFKPNHVSWLKSGETASGTIYPSAYNELLKILKKEEQKYGDFKVIRENDKEPDNDYGEYWIVNEKEQTFKTPLKTSLLNTISNARILIEKKEPTEEEQSWYNLYSDGWLEQGGFITVDSADSSNSVILCKPYKDTNYLINRYPQVLKRDLAVNYAIGITDGTKDTAGFQLLLTNTTYTDKIIWETKGYTELPSAEQIANSENIGLYFKVANAVENLELIKAGQILEDCVLKSELKEAQTVIDSYINDKSGYRVWSDGYCEQFGLYDNSQAGTIKLLKPYADFYNISVTPYVAGTPVYTSITNYNRQEFTFVCNSSATHGYYWQTSGYLTEGSY